MRRCRPELLRNTYASARPSRSAVSEVIGSWLATPRTPSVPNNLRWVLIGSYGSPLVVHAESNLVRRRAHQLHPVGQRHLQRQFVRTRLDTFGVHVGDAFSVQTRQLDRGTANRQRRLPRLDPKLEVAVLDLHAHSAKFSVGDHLVDVEARVHPSGRESHCRVGSGDIYRSVGVGVQAAQVEWLGAY